MEAATIISLAEAGITLVEKLAPLIQQAVNKGEISVAQQQALDQRIAALRPGGVAFAGPEWQVSK